MWSSQCACDVMSVWRVFQGISTIDDCKGEYVCYQLLHAIVPNNLFCIVHKIMQIVCACMWIMKYA